MPYPFSSRTTGFLVDAMVATFSGTNLDTVILKLEIDDSDIGGGNKEQRSQQICAVVRHLPEAKRQETGLELARLVLERWKPVVTWSPDPQAPYWWDNLVKAAAADGWEWDVERSTFVPTVPSAAVAEEVSWLDTELKRRGWSVAAGHYRQAVDSFATGNFAAANSQLRSFFEDLVTEGGGSAAGGHSGRVQRGFDALDSRKNLLSNEAEFGKALWKMLHPNGSHPGLSDQDESRFRLLTLTGYARFLLGRLP